MSRLTKSLVIALVASVLINVFVAGLWAGRLMRRGRPGRGPDVVDVDGDASGPMARVWRTHDASLRPKSEAVESARRAVRESLVAEPFNPEAMESALSQLRTETNGAQVALHHALVEAARELSVEDRRRMAESRWFLRTGPRRPPGMH
jgi:uncharacterized membrane protein